MGLLDLFKKSGSSRAEAVARQVEYEGYTIRPEPSKQQNGFVTAGYICKQTEDGEQLEQYFIRADTHADYDSASDHAIFKGKQIIKEFGDKLFTKG